MLRLRMANSSVELAGPRDLSSCVYVCLPSAQDGRQPERFRGEPMDAVPPIVDTKPILVLASSSPTSTSPITVNLSSISSPPLTHIQKLLLRGKQKLDRANVKSSKVRSEDQVNDHVNGTTPGMAFKEQSFLLQGRATDAYDLQLHQTTYGQPNYPLSNPKSHSINHAGNPKGKQTSPQRGQGVELQQNRPHHSFRRTPMEGDSVMIQGPPSSAGRRNNTFPRPLPQNFNGTAHRPLAGRMGGRQDNWAEWPELGVRISGLPEDVTTKDIWAALKGEGQIVTIEIFEDQNGKRDGKARVRFSPPPAKAFWEEPTYEMVVGGKPMPIQVKVELDISKRLFLTPSPVNPQVKYPEIMTMMADTLDFGFMYDPSAMMGMHRVHPKTGSGIQFRLNLNRREIDIFFQLVIEDPRWEKFKRAQRDSTKIVIQPASLGKSDRVESLRFWIPFAQPLGVHEIGTAAQVILLISMETPPNFYRKFDEGATHEPSANYWNHRDAWFRQTDILYSRKTLKEAFLSLKKSKPIIDIGRWMTYRFVFDMGKNDRVVYETMRSALKDFNVEIRPLAGFKLLTHREPAVWEYIDKPAITKRKKTFNALDELIEDVVPSLSFSVRYQLEVCISQGYLNEHNLTPEFVDKLIGMKDTEAQDLLEYVAHHKRRVYRPMEIFDIKIIKGSASRLKIPHYCAYIRSATVTPTTIYYNTPTVDTSNRVIRQYAEYADRFLRVRFTDEKFQGNIFANDGETMNEVFTRIKRAMNNGITIGDRHYEFLAFGNSQFRDHGAYFFAPVEHLRPEDIRRWMGDFKDIKVVAKHAARLGQCFSTTRAINGTKVTVKPTNDIKRGKYTFTDGVGKISKFLAQLAASELGLAMPSGEPPSVYQFRLGGCKGILTLCPDVKMRELYIRQSQEKFGACHEGLEIVRWSQFASAYLNRQIIIVLSALGVPDHVFVDKLKQQLSNLEQAMIDETMSLSLLQREIDPNQMTLAIAGMVLDGFQKVREPFLVSLLHLWRAWSIKYLKEKAKILVHEGALLLGCVDETGTLKGHFNNQQPGPAATPEERLAALPEVFVQLSKGENDKPQVIEGPIALARNPSLHPGDIRVVRGVSVPALHHLKDVVVLPQTGDRDVSNMCSGGDLDGDDYMVIWDKNLLPMEWNHPPMNYTPPAPVRVEREVSTNDITSFFVTYMKNDTLPRIAHAHLATADYMADGVKNEKCLRLADLHSVAVDYVKTGVPAVMSSDLRPKKWPHFMEKKNKPKEQIYISQKVLGQLYDQVERVDFVPDYDAPFDKRILAAYDTTEQTLSDAAEVKEQYDAAMYRIMAQHDIRTEFEVWSTFVMHHANQSKDFKFHEEMGEISVALKDRFRAACYEKAGGKDFDKIGPFVAAMYTVTHREMEKALAECRELKVVDGRDTYARQRSTKAMPLMSFPWLFHNHLGKIANGVIRPSAVDNVEASNSIRSGGSRKIVPKRGRAGLNPSDEDTLETAQGTIHRGELLELFSHEDDTIASTNGNPSSSHLKGFEQDSPISPEEDAYAGLDEFEKLSAFSIKPDLLDDLDDLIVPSPDMKPVVDSGTTTAKPVPSKALVELDITGESNGLVDLGMIGEADPPDQNTSSISATDPDAFAGLEGSDIWPTLTATKSSRLKDPEVEGDLLGLSNVSSTVQNRQESPSSTVINGVLEDEDILANRVISRIPALEAHTCAGHSKSLTMSPPIKGSPAPNRHSHSRVGSKTGLIFRAPETKPIMVVPKLGTLVDFGPDEKEIRADEKAVGSSRNQISVAKSGADPFSGLYDLESLSILDEPSASSDRPVVSQAETMLDLGGKTDESSVVGNASGATGVGTLIDFDLNEKDGSTDQAFSAISTTPKQAPFAPEYDLLTGIDEFDVLSPGQEMDSSSATALGVKIGGSLAKEEDLMQGGAFPPHYLNRVPDGETMHWNRRPTVSQPANGGSKDDSEDTHEIGSDGNDGEEEVILPISFDPSPFERLEALLNS